VLTDMIEPRVWETYAAKIVSLASKHGLSIKDPGCSTDAARILRIPGTYNFKNTDDPLVTSVLVEGVVTEWGTLKFAIQDACDEVGVTVVEKQAPLLLPKRPMDATTLALLGDFTSSFKLIATRSLSGTGCGHIAQALMDPENLPEPIWRTCLSTAKFCADGATAIHKLSKGHPEYTPTDTEYKASRIEYPNNCSKFAAEAGCDTCQTCPHWGRIKNPIQLGKEIAKAEPTASEIEAVESETETTIALSATPPALPDLPPGYHRGLSGSILREGAVGPDGVKGEPIRVYEYGLNVTRRITDPEQGACVVMTLDMPHDGHKEFLIPLSEAQSFERLKGHLAKNNVIGGKKQMNDVSDYVIHAVKLLQATGAAERSVTQMGWTEEKEIVVGRTRYTKSKGGIYCPPSEKARATADLMQVKGSFDVWQSLAAQYAAPGLELQACVLMFAFGSMLNGYAHDDPVWLHLVSKASGTGKTTLTRFCSSIWGSARGLTLGSGDTYLSVSQRRVIMNSMALGQDEITDMDSKELSRLAYSQSETREKMRLNSDSTQKHNSDMRRNTLITNGNAHIIDALSASRTNAAGQLARLLEIPFEEIANQMVGINHFDRMFANYGHAGALYAPWLVAHEDQLEDRVQECKARFAASIQSTTKERNWVSLSGGGFAALDIVQKELGLFKEYDQSRMWDAWGKFILESRVTVESSIVAHEHLLGDFINENYSNIIVPDRNASKVDDAATLNLYGRKNERDPKGRLVLRWEGDTRMLFVAQSELKTYCDRRHHSFIELLAHFNKQKKFALVSKRMGSDTGLPVSGSVRALAFHVPLGSELGDSLGGL